MGQELFPGFHECEVDAGDVVIRCRMGGDGPPVLLLHGFPQSLAMWARVAPLLAEEFTVVCADLRGYGDSTKPRSAPDSSNYSFRTMARDQKKLMGYLGFERFHVVGHDRGGRVGHRMALDHPDLVLSLAVLDIVPTYVMFMDTNRHIASAYWHWYFLSQPAPFPEKLITPGADEFFQTCLTGWGATRIEDFDPALLNEYRRCWRDPEMVHGACSDYRAAATIDLEHDRMSLDERIRCPTLVFYGANGMMAKCFDIPATWAPRCSSARVRSLPGGHFFVDQFPRETAAILGEHLREANEQIGAKR